MKLAFALSAIFTFGVVAGIPVGVSNCSALIKLWTDLNNTATFLHQYPSLNEVDIVSLPGSTDINRDVSHERASSPLTLKLIQALMNVQIIVEDIMITLNILSVNSRSDTFRMIQPIFPMIQQQLQSQITTFEIRVATGQPDDIGVQSMVQSLSNSLDRIITRFNENNLKWMETCDTTTSEPVQRDTLVSTLCLLFYALAQIIFLGLPFLGNILGLGVLFSYITLWVCRYL